MCAQLLEGRVQSSRVLCPETWNVEFVLRTSRAALMIRTMALRRMAASLLSRSLVTSQLVPQAATLRQCSLLHTPAQQIWNSWTPAVASGRICEATRAFSSGATSRVVDAIAAEIEFEKEDYSPPPVRCRQPDARPRMAALHIVPARTVCL